MEEYLKEILIAAKMKLSDANKPLSELELVSGIVHRLKNKLGSNDRRHSSKQRFKKDNFNSIVNSIEWKNQILQLSDKKYILKEEESKYVKTELTNQWTWAGITYNEAIELKLNNLKKINPYKLEKLTTRLLQSIYTDFSFITTSMSNDQGIDIIGIYEENSNLKEAIYVQVKQFSGKKVGSPEANSFVGALDKIIEKHQYSHLTCLFVTTSDFSKPFLNKIKESQEKNKSFVTWNGIELARQMLKNGLGVKYSLDIEFWKEIDSTAILENSRTKKKNK